MHVLTNDHVTTMPIDQINVDFEQAKEEFDRLLARVENDNRLKPILQAQIQAARLKYVMLRAKAKPEFAGKIATAA
ncbi:MULTISPECIES: hypothetical protein [unclassified Spirosoma]|uniref:hypothetical protein n=1 Tax=unclassified Spirosoma TaxID=2621999 RepID=UPI00095DC7D1|nr:MULTISPECIES: hypothetical protein [unclassified Spirosoma]MBN8820784.1 hypothetical protein [Spirosoma sp.]OJW76377.1 MAG: hypothetical protein BGO59_22925 [Spirosoma sp. 48-14]